MTESTGFPSEPDLPLPHRTPGEALAGAQSSETENGAQAVTLAMVDAGARAIAEAELELAGHPVGRYPVSWRRTIALAVLTAAEPHRVAGRPVYVLAVGHDLDGTDAENIQHAVMS